MSTALIPSSNKNNNIIQMIESNTEEIKKALPMNTNPERFVRIILTEIDKNPALLKCTPQSLLSAVMTSAQLGLDPSLQQCHLIPFGQKVTFVIDYKGLIQLIMRSGQVSDCYAETVYEKDVFEETLGLNRSIIHKKPPFGADRGKAIGYYAVIKLTNGGKLYKSMSKSEVEDHALKYSKQKSGNSLINIWKSEFDKMAQKTVLRQLVKFSPLSSDLKKELEQDNTIREVISGDMALEGDYRQTGQKVRDTFEESYSPSPQKATLEDFLSDDDGEESESLTCSACNAGITDKVKDYSSNKYGKALCFNCQTKEANNG